MKNNMCQFCQKEGLSPQFGRDTGGTWDCAKEGAKPKVDPGLKRSIVTSLGQAAWASPSACKPSACFGPAVYQFAHVCREGRKEDRKERRKEGKEGQINDYLLQ